jgi:hypothetical protein
MSFNNYNNKVMTDNLLLPGDSYLVYLSVAEVKATSKKA